MTLRNPVLPGLHPDPSVVCVDGRYVLVTSTFAYLPGIPVHVSEDLENWSVVGHVVTGDSQVDLRDVPSGHGVWAPTIRHRDGTWFVIVTVAGGHGCLLFTADRPEGPWGDPVRIEGIEGIDPDLAWDEKGTAIVTYASFITHGPDYHQHRGIRQVDVDLTDGRLLSEPRDLWSGTGLQFPEAPHLYRRGSHWYLLLAEGGTESGHCVSVARSTSPRGPFEGAPGNPILSARSTDRPVQNTGHGDLVDTPDGRTLMLLLGTRPRGRTKGFSAIGRETFVTEVRWEEGWPVAAPVTLSAAGAEEQEISFAEPLDPLWVAVRRMPGEIADLESRPGQLTLHGEGEHLSSPRAVFVGRRQRHHAARVSTTVDARGGSGGLAVRYDEDFVYSLTVSDDGSSATVVAEARVAGITQQWQAMLPSGPVELTLDMVPPAAVESSTCDVVRLVVQQGQQELELAAVDGRYLSAETAASFAGRIIGVFVVSGSVAFDGYRYVGSHG